MTFLFCLFVLKAMNITFGQSAVAVPSTAAAEQLLAKIQRPHEEHPAQVVFPMALLVRESTGPAKPEAAGSVMRTQLGREALFRRSPSAEAVLDS